MGPQKLSMFLRKKITIFPENPLISKYPAEMLKTGKEWTKYLSYSSWLFTSIP
jgi:hypothetical protein